jgi:hypothetical protein
MGDTVGLIAAVTILALLVGVVLFVGHVQPAKVLVAAAARNCARAGVETLAAGRGLAQARATAVETAWAGLGGTTGLAIDPEGLVVQAYAEEVWGRGRVFVCETGYGVRVDHLPLVGWFYPGSHVSLRARAALTIEPYEARWGE